MVSTARVRPPASLVRWPLLCRFPVRLFHPLLVGSQCSGASGPVAPIYNSLTASIALLRSLFRTAWVSLGVLLRSHDMHDLGSQRGGWFSPPPPRCARGSLPVTHSERKSVLPKILLNLAQTSSTQVVPDPVDVHYMAAGASPVPQICLVNFFLICFIFTQTTPQWGTP